MYRISLQKTKAGKFRVCLSQSKNGKLVLQGEPISRMADAMKIAQSVRVNVIEPGVIDLLPATHKWVKNSGPKRKAPK